MAKEKKRGAAREDARKKTTGKRTVTGTDQDLQDAVDGANVSGSIWKPKKKGDTLIGDVLTCRSESGEYGLQIKSIIGTETGALTVFLNSSMMRGFQDQGVDIGDRVAIQYKDDSKGSRGKPMALYAVVRKGGAGTMSDTLKDEFEAVWQAKKDRAEERKKEGKRGKKKAKKKRR